MTGFLLIVSDALDTEMGLPLVCSLPVSFAAGYGSMFWQVMSRHELEESLTIAPSTPCVIRIDDSPSFTPYFDPLFSTMHLLHRDTGMEQLPNQPPRLGRSPGPGRRWRTT